MTQPELGRGYIDYLEYSNNHLTIAGWMFVQSNTFDMFRIKINNVAIADTTPAQRQDVQSAFPSMPNALRSGFSFHAPVKKELFADWVTLEIAGVSSGIETGRIITIYHPEFHSSLPEPPANLMQRVANVGNPVTYWCRALHSYSEFLRAIQTYSDINSISCMLDWGCGCGRVVSMFLKHLRIPEIHGCDIDRETVEWCSEHLKPGQFSVINPFPPTNYTDNMFDIIISYSVFTHLQRDVQLSWIKEMKRILMPGGLFFASVHGDFATSFTPPHIQEEVERNGISDSSLDPNLDGIAPEGYYRGVYQTRDYTVRELGKYFRVVDYRERVMGNFQDLVILQKKR
jgi:SAM-dependent methyltransferase